MNAGLHDYGYRICEYDTKRVVKTGTIRSVTRREADAEASIVALAQMVSCDYEIWVIL